MHNLTLNLTKGEVEALHIIIQEFIKIYKKECEDKDVLTELKTYLTEKYKENMYDDLGSAQGKVMNLHYMASITSSGGISIG